MLPRVTSQLEDIDGTLNESISEKISQYHTDYNNRPSNVISLHCVGSGVKKNDRGGGGCSSGRGGQTGEGGGSHRI